MKEILYRNSHPFKRPEKSRQGMYEVVSAGSCHQIFDSADHEKNPGRSYGGKHKALMGNQYRPNAVKDSAVLIENITDERKKKEHADGDPAGFQKAEWKP